MAELHRFKRVFNGLLENVIPDRFSETHLPRFTKYLTEEDIQIARVATNTIATYEVDLFYWGILEQFESGCSQWFYDALQLIWKKYQFLRCVDIHTKGDFEGFSSQTHKLPCYIWAAYWLGEMEIYHGLVKLLTDMGRNVVLGLQATEGFDNYHEYWSSCQNFIASVESGKLTRAENSGVYDTFYSGEFKEKYVEDIANIHWNRAIKLNDKGDDVSQGGAFPVFPFQALAYWKFMNEKTGNKYVYEHSILTPYQDLKFKREVRSDDVKTMLGMLNKRLEQDLGMLGFNL